MTVYRKIKQKQRLVSIMQIQIENRLRNANFGRKTDCVMRIQVEKTVHRETKKNIAHRNRPK